MLSFLLRDPERRAVYALLGYGFLVAGCGLLCAVCVRLGTRPWSFAATAKTTLSIASEPGPYWGVQHVIEVAGQRYTCSDGRTRAPKATPTEVVYDSDDPSRCRARAEVGRLGAYESIPLFAALSWLALGASTVLRIRGDSRMTLEPERPSDSNSSLIALDAVFVAGLLLQAICGTLVIVFQ